MSFLIALYKRKYTSLNHLTSLIKTKNLCASKIKSLYGLKQALSVSYEKLTQALLQNGFSHTKCDHSLFVYSHQGVTLYALAHVDDILIIDSSSNLVHKIINNSNITLSLKKLDRLAYFSKIEVKYVKWIHLSTHSKYINDLQARAKLCTANEVHTPMLSKCKWIKYGSSSFLYT